MTGMGKKIFLVVLMWLLSPVYAGAEAGAGTVKLSVVPDHIQVGAFYHGATVHISAEIPVCDGAVLKIEGEDNEVVLNRKGKVAIIWLNVAQVTVKNAPQVYILAASDKLTSISSRQERERLGLGLEALKKRITFESDKPLTGSEFDEFLKLKKHSGTYQLDTGIDLRPINGNRQELSAVLSLPSAMPPGDYTVWLYCFQQGSLIEEANVQLSIGKGGLPRLMTSLAHEHPAAYGILAIVVAMVAGLGMGIIFSSRAGRGH